MHDPNQLKLISENEIFIFLTTLFQFLLKLSLIDFSLFCLLRSFEVNVAFLDFFLNLHWGFMKDVVTLEWLRFLRESKIAYQLTTFLVACLTTIDLKAIKITYKIVNPENFIQNQCHSNTQHFDWLQFFVPKKTIKKTYP